jgi:hypothetical protein
MFDDPTVATINALLIIGSVLAFLAAISLKRSNKALHLKNVKARQNSGE